MTSLVKRLKKEDMMPCIFFLLSIHDCTSLASFFLTRKLQLLDNLAHRAKVEASVERLRLLGIDALQLNLLKNGIGLHHSKQHPQLKMEIESLFRAGILKLIVATSTLALGVHMPCKAVVFVRDNKAHLDCATFHQMVGRAGRQGIEENPIGNVIITGNFDFYRIEDLFLSRFANHRNEGAGLSLNYILQLMYFSYYNLRKENSIEVQLTRSIFGEKNPTKLKSHLEKALTFLRMFGFITLKSALTVPGKMCLDLFLLETPLSFLFVDALPAIAAHLAHSNTDEKVFKLLNVLANFYPPPTPCGFHKDVPALHPLPHSVAQSICAFNEQVLKMLMDHDHSPVSPAVSVRPQDLITANHLLVSKDDKSFIPERIQALSGHCANFIEYPTMDWLELMEGLTASDYPFASHFSDAPFKAHLTDVILSDLSIEDAAHKFKMFPQDIVHDLKGISHFVERLNISVKEAKNQKISSWIPDPAFDDLSKTLDILQAKTSIKMTKLFF
jgi:hypothetical protein